MYTVGQIAGSLYAGQIADRFGRRAGMFTGGCIILIGTTVIASSHTIKQFIAGISYKACILILNHAHSSTYIPGRFVLGMGIAVAITAAPAYIIEA